MNAPVRTTIAIAGVEVLPSQGRNAGPNPFSKLFAQYTPCATVPGKVSRRHLGRGDIHSTKLVLQLIRMSISSRETSFVDYIDSKFVLRDHRMMNSIGLRRLSYAHADRHLRQKSGNSESLKDMPYLQARGPVAALLMRRIVRLRRNPSVVPRASGRSSARRAACLVGWFQTS